MREVNTENNILEEEYLDCLIKLAFDMDDAEKEQQIKAEAKDDELAPDEFTVRRTWQMAQEKMDRQEQEEKRIKRRNAVRRTVPQVLKIAACLLLAISIGVPVVIASSAEIRARVIRMLTSFDQENQQVNFVFEENTDASFAVPAEWDGDYFMSWIPDGMTVIWPDSPGGCDIEYADLEEKDAAKRRFLAFSELSEKAGAASGTEDAVVSYADIGGREACVIEYTEDRGISITWQNDEKMFALGCRNITKDEAIQIARNVRKIIR